MQNYFYEKNAQFAPALPGLHIYRVCYGSSHQRRGKEDDEAGAVNQTGTGHCKIREVALNSPSHFPAFLEKVLILPACRILINSFYLFLKECRKPAFDRGGGCLQKLNLKVSDVSGYTRKLF